MIAIYDLMKTINRIIMTIDGSVIKYKGSIGFDLTTDDGMVLLSCYVQPAGLDSLSFQSVAFAFLTATQLVFLIA